MNRIDILGILGRTVLHQMVSALHSLCFPRGSTYPTSEVSGSKSHTLNGIWDQRPIKFWVLGASGFDSKARPGDEDQAAAAQDRGGPRPATERKRQAKSKAFVWEF